MNVELTYRERGNILQLMTREPRKLKLDEVGDWSALKLEILRKYAAAYSKILTAQGKFQHAYIDGFAGAGHHVLKRNKELIAGSPLNALNIVPPFHELYLIDLDSERAAELKRLTADHPNVHIYEGDCNSILLNEVLPKIKYGDYKRGLCILDPYGLHLNWEVISTAAKMGTLEIFLNFPILDMNRNVLLWDPENAATADIARMNAFWGDESWRKVAWRTDLTLFEMPVKQSNEVIAQAFRERLKKVAGFKFVPEPVPMRNSKGAVLYYLYFASQNNTGEGIVSDIFNRYRKRGAFSGGAIIDRMD